MTDLSEFRVVRLDAHLFPVDGFEREQWCRYNLRPIEADAATLGELIRDLAGCDALFAVSNSMPRQVIETLSRCRVISRLGMGTDKIDVAAATAAGILVTNVPHFCAEEQADHALALMLALARQIPRMTQAMHAGTWRMGRQWAQTNRRLSTLTLGLVGFGRSGKATAQRARGFGMKVLACRRRQIDDPQAYALGVEMVELDTLLANSDYVSLHLPLTLENYHLFDAATLGKMKPGAYLINTSRGALVDETALVAALRSGRLAGAGLDTFEQINVHTPQEGPVSHPLLELDNVVLTPHVAAGSVEAHEEVMAGGVQNLAEVLCGRWPLRGNIVNPGVRPRYPLSD